MATFYLTHDEIENLLRSAVCTILDIPDSDNKAVRFPYSTQTESAPGITRDMDVCFIYVIPADDGYGQQRHISYTPDNDPDSSMLTRVDKHTDIYDVRFVFYGPNSFERARRLKDSLSRDDIRKLLKESGFFLRAGIPPLEHIHEIREGDWWTRCDVTPRFYSSVRTETPGYAAPIESVSINIKR